MKLLLILNFFALALAEIQQKSPKTISNKLVDIEPTEETESIGISSRFNYEDLYTQPKNKEDSFDWKLTKEVFKQYESENVIVSPVSVKLLLTVLAEAASQDVSSPTRDQLEMVLPHNKTLNCARGYFERILSALEEPSSKYTLNIGSKSFLRQDVYAAQRVKANLELFYKMHMEQVDFTDSVKLADQINDWVSQITNGKISSLVDTETISNSAMLLINAIYFRGLWKVPFEKTLVEDFQVETGVTVTREFVDQISEFYYLYSKSLAAKIVRLPYEGGNFSMFVLLPFAADGLNQLVENLDAETLRKEVDRMEMTEVEVKLPKFRFDSSLKLKSVVQALGIQEIFEDNATFPLLTGKSGIKVSNIIQKSGIVVDEKGSEAFAATEIELIDKFGGNPREFYANHPFVFYIEDDRTGAKLFSGVVNNPEY